MRSYKGIDIARVFFACLIPLLHIALPQSTGLYIVRQYLSRLGVPFFFAVSGMFLTKSIEKYGKTIAWKRYSIRVGRVLLFWLLIYSPLLIVGSDSFVRLIQEVLFKTPAFLWYLSSLLFAAIPFCLIENKKLLAVSAIVLYITGTIFGESYKWLIGGAPGYERVFLTTRNGLFFGLPMMCIGSLIWKSNRKSKYVLIVSGIALFAEITFVGLHAGTQDDRSMYFCLPVFTYALIKILKDWNPEIKGKHLGGISSAIYMMQYGVITVCTIIITYLGLSESNAIWFIYLAVIIIPVLFYWIFRNTKIVEIIF